MKKIIVPLIIAGILLAGNLFAQKINAKITDSVNVTCTGDSNGSAAVQGIGGYTPYTYLWEPGGQTTDTATGLAAGTYTATVIDTASDTAEAIATIGTAAPPIVVATSSSEPSCFGMNNAMAAITSITGGTPPFQIEWLPIMNNNDTVTGLPASTYTAQVTDANGCQVQTPVPVSQPPPLQLTAAAIGNFIQAYTTGGTMPYTYAWYPTISTTSLATGLSAGTYTVTVHDSNQCSDSLAVVVPDAQLSLYMAYGPENCTGPDYYTFYIKTYSDSVRTFNSCVIDLNLGSQFYGDSVSNGGVIVKQGDQFLPGPGNDYNILNVTNLSPDVVQIAFGDTLHTSPNGTLIGSAQDTLLQVTLKMQDCFTMPVCFTNTDTTETESYFTLPAGADSVVSDSALQYVCHCGHYTCYNFDSTADSLCCCVDSFNYRYFDTTLHTTISEDFPFIATNYSGCLGIGICQPVITSINSSYNSIPINAGTNAKSVSPDPSKIPPNSSIFIITGYSFGTDRGTIEVSDADSGFDGKGHYAMIPLDSVDILNWTDTLIKIRMPSVIRGAGGHTPGTGPFYVINACGNLAWGNLQINYSIYSDVVIDSGTTIKFRPNIVMAKVLQTDTTSFNWRCDTSVSQNPKALACVKKALREWNCYTGINWKLQADTAGDTISKQDGTSVIYFSKSFSPFLHILVATHPWYYYNTCHISQDSVTFFDEADMQINSRENWSYDTTGTVFSKDSDYFYDNMLHEMGHALGLGHINDTLSLMYYATAQNFRPFITSQGPYYPGPATLLGAMDMIYTSVLPANNPHTLGCFPFIFTQLDTDSRFCFDPTLSVPTIPENAYNLNLFPNPIDYGNLTVTYGLKTNSDVQFRIMDCTGRMIMELNEGEKAPGEYSEKINISNLAGGVYLFTAIINGALKTIKFIKI